MGWGLDSTSANASTMHFVTCRHRERAQNDSKSCANDDQIVKESNCFNYQPSVSQCYCSQSELKMKSTQLCRFKKCLLLFECSSCAITHPLIQRLEALRWEIKIISTPIVLSMSSQSHMPVDFSSKSLNVTRPHFTTPIPPSHIFHSSPLYSHLSPNPILETTPLSFSPHQDVKWIYQIMEVKALRMVSIDLSKVILSLPPPLLSELNCLS